MFAPLHTSPLAGEVEIDRRSIEGEGLALFFIIFGFLFLLHSTAFAAPKFPALTGRVVDDAHILSAGTVQSLEQELADYERGTTNQIVVVTLSSLQDYDIADYGYQLGRAWGIGQKGKDNGALLIVAPHERKVRIEVGYGLEGTLTDAESSQIIQQIILPDFKQGNMEQGVVDGTHAILSVLGGQGIPSNQSDPTSLSISIFLIIFLFLFMTRFLTRHPLLAAAFGINAFYGSSSGGFGGGGFSGGGGSFGGGGASGSW